jgi:predicted Zn finger-like uncharacterized protein
MNGAPKPWLTSFRCPRCGASYQVVRIDDAETPNQAEVNCLVCGEVFPAHDGSSFLKYFLTPAPIEPHRCG